MADRPENPLEQKEQHVSTDDAPTDAAAPEADPPAAAGERRPSGEIIIITGLAGAGRETAAHALEDLGWYVVYNIVPQLIPTLYELQATAEGRDNRFAVVVDPRSGPFFGELAGVVAQLRRSDVRLRLVFLTADEATLVRRFDSVRRPHPMQGEEGVLEGIRRERELLAPYRRTADVVIDTSPLNVHELTMKMRSTFGTRAEQQLTVTMLSFGFKYGIPLEADHVSDVRFIPNPYWVPELKPLRGTDREVSDFVLGDANAAEFVDRYLEMITPVLRGYTTENKHSTTLAIGCTGGKHRSVAISERIGEELRRAGHAVRIRHRDLGRE
ncbi:RNase adapter RapZ [Brachybacterium sp. p3-SID1565]|uniref:RNase adapter RapZ n=1 Tax=Brachybacterium sp. p3-SID1565 TaxID=2916046 RepID=UPI0021A6778C|nr:RNase adapter RapZ [Brachybacterium sp. p3-SID1565]MCT1384892.1 RNase adapter RapZ [Brachybacterium sp. p3-SID1565]